MNSESFQTLLERAKGNDGQALRLVMERFGYIVNDVCRRVSLPAADLSVSDLRQECWLRVWLKLDKFNCDEDDDVAVKKFAKWLRTLSSNIVNDLLRKRTAKKRGPKNLKRLDLQVNGHSSTPSKRLIKDETIELVRVAIESLSDPLLKEIIVDFFEKDSSFDEISKRLELSYDQVRYKFNLAVKQIERRLNL